MMEHPLTVICPGEAASPRLSAVLEAALEGCQAQVLPRLEGPPEGAEPAPPASEEPPGVPDLSALLGQIDPKMLQAGMEIVRQVQGTEDRNTALLNALRPFLREERQARLDRAMQIARMTRIIRVALTALGGKEGERV